MQVPARLPYPSQAMTMVHPAAHPVASEGCGACYKMKGEQPLVVLQAHTVYHHPASAEVEGSLAWPLQVQALKAKAAAHSSEDLTPAQAPGCAMRLALGHPPAAS